MVTNVFENFICVQNKINVMKLVYNEYFNNWIQIYIDKNILRKIDKQYLI